MSQKSVILQTYNKRKANCNNCYARYGDFARPVANLPKWRAPGLRGCLVRCDKPCRGVHSPLSAGHDRFATGSVAHSGYDKSKCRNWINCGFWQMAQGKVKKAPQKSINRAHRAVVSALQFALLISLFITDRFPMAEFVISPAHAEDVPVVHSMICELAEYERLTHLVSSTPRDLADALFGDHPTVEVAVGREDGAPAAFALYFHNFSTFLGRRGLYLEDLFVRPAYRRRGYGRALLIHLARLAKARQCGRFEWAVLDWNTTAIAFYESLGGKLLHDWRITRVTGPALDALANQPLLLDQGNSYHA